MKKILLIILFICSVFSSVFVKAQSFYTEADTVWATASLSTLTHATDTVIASSPVALTWRVYSTTFPADWQIDTVLGICDANLCRQNTGGTLLWNGTSGTSFNCTYPNPVGNSNDFHLAIADLFHE